MKKIILTIFGLLLMLSFTQVALAAEPEITIPNGAIDPPNQAPIGAEITINFKVKNTPANASKIQLLIKDTKDQIWPKAEWPATDGDFTYKWQSDREAIPGTYTIIIREIDLNVITEGIPDGVVVGNELYHTYQLVGANTVVGPPRITIEYGDITPPNTAKIGTQVGIKFSVENTPANASKIQLWISDTNQDSLKKEWVAKDGVYNFTWDTSESIAGKHMIAIKAVNSTGQTVGEVLHHSYQLTEGDGPGNPGDPGDPPNNDPQYNPFDLNQLGKVNPLTVKINSLEDAVMLIINWVIFLAGALAVVAIIYSGILYMTAGGDQAKAETGKKNLLWAIIGLIACFTVLVVIAWIKQFLTTGNP